MADKYGPIFTLRLGVHPTLIVSSWEIAKECFTVNDRAFASRPKFVATEVMGYNFSMLGGSPYGSYWRHVWKIATLEVISNHRLEMLKHVRESEVKSAMKDTYNRWVELNNSSNQKLEAVPLSCEMEKWKSDSGQVKPKHRDFMDMLLSNTDEAEMIYGYDSNTMVKATCLVLILAATDTTTATLTWALSLLMNNNEVFKEGTAPLSVMHRSTEDYTVAGYHIPSGTHLLTNLYKIHRDPKAYEDPLEFRPERFLTTHKNVDLRGQHFELIPFGAGRRMCPGVSFALLMMQLTLANLLTGFHIATPDNKPVDMREQVGLTNIKASTLQVLLTPRLSPHLYA
ncbi:hypothetical protein K1719_010618 [Acacia pycnantha]|nr:hypothetical protein K1719_010618 [Acacia pycnantha]